jgi:hypothetical protein
VGQTWLICLQLGNGFEIPAILVTEWPVQQKLLNGVDA